MKANVRIISVTRITCAKASCFGRELARIEEGAIKADPPPQMRLIGTQLDILCPSCSEFQTLFFSDLSTLPEAAV